MTKIKLSIKTERFLVT